MPLDNKFAAAYIDNNNKHWLLGARLRPFCAWHMWLLQAIDSPFLGKGKITAFDLKTAIGICRLRYRQSRVHRPIIPILTQKRLEKATAQFLDYIGDYLNKPDYNIIPFEPAPGAKAPIPVTPPPDMVMLVFDAANGARVSVEEAWNMPIGEAYIAQSMFLRQQGIQVNFMDLAERLFQKELIEHGIK